MPEGEDCRFDHRLMSGHHDAALNSIVPATRYPRVCSTTCFGSTRACSDARCAGCAGCCDGRERGREVGVGAENVAGPGDVQAPCEEAAERTYEVRIPLTAGFVRSRDHTVRPSGQPRCTNPSVPDASPPPGRLDQDPSAVNGKPGITVRHEDLRAVKPRHLHHTGGLRHVQDQTTVNNARDQYTKVDRELAGRSTTGHSHRGDPRTAGQGRRSALR